MFWTNPARHAIRSRRRNMLICHSANPDWLHPIWVRQRVNKFWLVDSTIIYAYCLICTIYTTLVWSGRNLSLNFYPHPWVYHPRLRRMLSLARNNRWYWYSRVCYRISTYAISMTKATTAANRPEGETRPHNLFMRRVSSKNFTMISYSKWGCLY